MKILNWAYAAQESIAQRSIDIKHPGDLCDLNLPIGNSNYFVTKTGAVLTAIRLNGYREFVTRESFAEIVVKVTDVVEPMIRQGETQFGWYYSQLDEQGTNEAHIKSILGPLRDISETHKYKNTIFIDETISVNKDIGHREESVLCVWTTSASRGSSDADMPFYKAGSSQDTVGYREASKKLLSHKATIQTIVDAMKTAGFYVEALSNMQISRLMAETVDPTANEGFTPRLFGTIKERTGNEEKVEAGAESYEVTAPQDALKAHSGTDYSMLFPPKIGRQIWTQKPRYEGESVVIGRRAYTSIILSMQPSTHVPFVKLQRDLKQHKIPFRFAQHNRSKGMAIFRARHAIVSFLKKMPATNNQILGDTLERMKEYIRDGNAALTVQTTITVWAPIDEPNLLSERVEQALKVINQWGGATGQVLSDDPLLGFISTIPGYRAKQVAPMSIGPAHEVMYRAPLTRPALPWKHGAIVLTSQNGKPLPIQPLSDGFTHHVYLICGEPGYGKSLICQVMIIAACEYSDRLPYIAISDVGPGSLGTVRYLQSILPPSRKHWVMYAEMRNTREMSINRFDTPLGVQMPPDEDIQGMVEWLSLCMTNAQSAEAPAGTSEIAHDIVKLAFERCASSGPRSEPNRYQRAHENDPLWRQYIAPVLKNHRIELNNRTIYWDVVDQLFDLKEYHAAALIQRYAVPLMEHMVAAANAKEITHKHRREISPKFTLADQAYQSLVSAKDEIKVTQLPTQFDLTDTRITAFNLEHVVSNTDTPSAKRRGAIFMGLTSALQVDQFFWNEMRVSEMPEKYRAFHRKKLQDIVRTKNLYFADEQHYYAGIEAAAQIPKSIALLGRKRGVGVMLSSQFPSAFDEEVRAISTMRMYMGFSRRAIPGVVETMQLDEREEYLLNNEIEKPGRNGSSFLVQVDHETGHYSQFVTLKVGVRKLWSLSTKNQSSYVREKLIDEFTYERGIEILARLYPSGQVEDEYERLIAQRSDNSSSDIGLDSINNQGETEDALEHILNKAIEQSKNINYSSG